MSYYCIILDLGQKKEKVFGLIQEAKKCILEKGRELLVTQVHVIASLALIYDVSEDTQPLLASEDCSKQNQEAKKENEEEEEEEEEEDEEEEDEEDEDEKRKGNAFELEQSGSNTEANPERQGEEQMEED